MCLQYNYLRTIEQLNRRAARSPFHLPRNSVITTVQQGAYVLAHCRELTNFLIKEDSNHNINPKRYSKGSACSR